MAKDIDALETMDEYSDDEYSAYLEYKDLGYFDLYAPRRHDHALQCLYRQTVKTIDLNAPLW